MFHHIATWMLLVFAVSAYRGPFSDIDSFKSWKRDTIACDGKVDIAFILDNSRSIYFLDFVKMKEFVQDLVAEFDIGPKNVRIGHITFGEFIYRDDTFTFDQYQTKDDVLAAIGGVVQRFGDQTNTHLALKEFRDVILPGARPGVATVLIVITDGESTYPDRTAEQASITKDTRTNVFAIGVGSDISVAMKEELRRIASSSDTVYESPSFSALKAIKGEVRRNICRVIPKTTLPPPPPTTTTPRRPPPPKPTPGPLCESSPADIAFILDNSRSIYSEDFKKMKKFLLKFVSGFEISPSKVRFAQLNFGKVVYTDATFTFDQYQTEVTLLAAIGEIEQRFGDQTNTHLALKEFRDVILPGARPGVKTVLIVITDGESTYPEFTEEQARLTKDTGIDVFAIGVGNDMSDAMKLELRTIASSSSKVFETPSFTALQTIEVEVKEEVCRDLATLPPPPTTTTTRRPPPPKPTPPPCGGKADVTFILDNSRSIYPPDFTQMKTFVQNIVANFPSVGPSGVRIAQLNFGDIVYRDATFGFDRYQSESEVVSAIGAIAQRLGSQTNTHLALKEFRDVILPESRPSVKNILVVITDGESTYPEFTEEQARLVQDSGVEVYAIGVGSNMSDEMKAELRVLASREDNVFESTFSALLAIEDNVMREVCRG